MKLSEAMMLGSVTCKMVSFDINTCAIGCALNALGVPSCKHLDSSERYDVAYERFPWLIELKFQSVDGIRCTGMSAVYSRFDNEVCRGAMTLEQLVDYVRSIEPSCGECNRFECSCVKSEALPVAESVLV